MSSSQTTPRMIRKRQGVPLVPLGATQCSLAEELSRRWRKGEHLLVEEFLAQQPDVYLNAEQIIELVCEEICLRREHGERISYDDFRARFPQLSAEIRVLLDNPPPFTERTAPQGFPEPGETLAGFHLLAELGRGASSRVFLAHQRSLSDRPVVVKVVPPQTAEHFSLARLQHTHIVPLYSTHRVADGAWLFLCMPYFGSKTLASVLDRLKFVPLGERTGQRILDVLDEEAPGFPSLPRLGTVRKFLARISYVSAVCWIGACLAEALQFAHEHDLVHLDIKPSNILLTAEAQPMLLDFHLAQPTVTHTAHAVWLGGTQGYMSPEQRRALDNLRVGNPFHTRIDARSDLYSLGVLLCEALGSVVTPEHECALPSHPNVSRGLRDILAHCLASAPQDRYQSASELAEDLRRHLNDQPLMGVANCSWLERWRKWRRRSPQLLLRYVVAALLLSTAVLGVILWTQWRGTTSPAATEVAPHERARVAQHVHEVAERLRRVHATESPQPAAQEALEAEARAIWDQRQRIAQHVPLHHELKDDLFDVFLLALPSQAPAAETAAALEEAMTFFGLDPVLLLERARFAQALGQNAQEKELLAQAAASEPRSAWEHYRLGRKLLHDKRLVEARRQLARAVELEPGRFWPQFHRGVCARRCAAPEEAVSAFSACIDLSVGSDRGLCHFERGRAFAQLGQDTKAIEDYGQALALDPQFSLAVSNRGLLLYKRGDHKQALADLRQAEELGGDLDALQYNQALVHLALNDKKSAASCLDTLQRRNPTHPEAAKLRIQLRTGR